MERMNSRTRRKVKNTLLMAVVLGTLIISTGCQAASDLFNPDTYSWNYNKEPWEKNFKRNKAPKNKNIATDY